MTIDLIRSTLNQVMVQNCVLMVQSHFLGSGFNPQLFFSGSLLNAVRGPLQLQESSSSGVMFMCGENFD